jgi:hypothetical protein
VGVSGAGVGCGASTAALGAVADGSGVSWSVGIVSAPLRFCGVTGRLADVYGRIVVAELSTLVCMVGTKWTRVAQRFRYATMAGRGSARELVTPLCGLRPITVDSGKPTERGLRGVSPRREPHPAMSSRRSLRSCQRETTTPTWGLRCLNNSGQ